MAEKQTTEKQSTFKELVLPVIVLDRKSVV